MNVSRFQVEPGARRPLDTFPPNFTGGLADKAGALKHLQKRLPQLEALRQKLYAQHEHSLLVILQGMDTAGKDSIIQHVFSGFNPQGITVQNFKQPSSEELSHDFLWRVVRALPEHGRIVVFNRSYYEEVLVVRVHPELLERQGLPKERVRPKIW